MKDNIMHAFGKTPDIFTQRVELTLLRLEERPMKKAIRKSVIIAIAALITLLGVAAAAGSTYLFEVFGKQPLDNAEDSIIEVASEEIKVNDDITATVDQVYYDGTEILYEMTLTLTDPDKYALIDGSAIVKNYAPPADITHIHVDPRVFDRFEPIEEFFGEGFAGEDQNINFSYEEDAVLEKIDNGVYKLYGNFIMHLDENQPPMLSEMDLDINLNLTYAPQNADFHVDQESVDAFIPFHATKTAQTKVYNLTPTSLPEGMFITEATLTASDVDAKVEIAYNFGGPLIPRDEIIYDMADPGFMEQHIIGREHTYDFHLQDPDNPGEYIGERHGSEESYHLFTAEVELPAMEQIPESLVFDVTHYDILEDQTSWVELPVATIEFTVTEAE